MNIWELSPIEIEDFQGGDGGGFRDFVNRLIHAGANACGIQSSSIATDSRNTGDGGVDCLVVRGSETDTSGWLRSPTCWQFKATAHTQLTAAKLKKEIRKPFCSEKLKEGFAYRLCIADSITAKKRCEWEKLLAEEVEAINPLAPSPKVLASDSLASWANRFLGVVAACKKLGDVWDLQRWGRQITHQTRSYIRDSTRDNLRERLRIHADLSRECSSPVMSLHGASGVGKTRLVYETLAEVPTIASMVVYTSEGVESEQIVGMLSSRQDLFAVVVIDECSLGARCKIETRLTGHAAHVRVITIENYNRLPSSPEPTLEPISDAVVAQILSENFPDVSENTRLAAVELAGGFVKIAADICRAGVYAGLSTIKDYYHIRVPDPASRRVIEGISLISKIGFKKDRGEEFDELCRCLELHPADSRERAIRLKDSPGWIALGGSYCYVTPEAIAQIALEYGWERWVDDRLETFLNGLPKRLLLEFEARVSASGSPAIRAALASHHAEWIATLRSSDLTDAPKVERLVGLVEIEPQSLFSQLLLSAGGQNQPVMGESKPATLEVNCLVAQWTALAAHWSNERTQDGPTAINSRSDAARLVTAQDRSRAGH